MTIEEIIENNDFQNSYFFSSLQRKILSKLEESSALTRRDLVKLLETPRSTIYDNLSKLEKKKLVAKFSRNQGSIGRPLIFWKIVY